MYWTDKTLLVMDACSRQGAFSFLLPLNIGIAGANHAPEHTATDSDDCRGESRDG